jgi:hypothetical protein
MAPGTKREPSTELLDEIGREGREARTGVAASPDRLSSVAAAGSTTVVPQNGHDALASGIGVWQDTQRMKVCRLY